MTLAVALQFLVVVQIHLLSSRRNDLIKRRHGNVDMAVIDQFRHESVQECQKQRVDVASVYIRIRHEDNLVVF